MDEHDVTARFEAEAILQRTRLIQQAGASVIKCNRLRRLTAFGIHMDEHAADLLR
jgi:hypothetical protein